MLIGDYRCSVDAKGRVSFPAKLRADLGARFIITRSLSDHCISVYSLEEWQSIIDRLHAMPQNKSRNIRRMLSGFASEAEPDAQGRIVLPISLREYAGLSKEAVIIGASTHCEIWSRENWEALCNELDSDTIAAVMDELNF